MSNWPKYITYSSVSMVDSVADPSVYREKLDAPIPSDTTVVEKCEYCGRLITNHTNGICPGCGAPAKWGW